MYTTLKDGVGPCVDHLGMLSRGAKGDFPKMNVDVLFTRPEMSKASLLRLIGCTTALSYLGI